METPFTIPTLEDLTISTYSNSYLECESGSNNIEATSVCELNDYMGCNNTDVVNNNGSICCTGVESCFESSMATSSQTTSSIRCDGVGSCLGLNGVTSNGNFYFSGRDSGAYLATSITAQMDVFCSGTSGCRDMEVISGTTTTNVYCTAYEACSGATI